MIKFSLSKHYARYNGKSKERWRNVSIKKTLSHITVRPVLQKIIKKKKKKKTKQSTLDISNTDISKYPLISKNIVWTHFQFLLYFNFFDLKLPVSRSKFSGNRIFSLRYQ